MQHNPRIAVIGAGYWGKNLVRVFHELNALACVCDTSEQTLADVREKYNVATCTALETVLANPEMDAVVIAAPAAQHFQLARKCLLAGKDVYVEKPLALHASEGQQLVDLANKCGRILMVGHILEYHPAILELKRLICQGELGNIQYIYSSRLNLGKLRTEENILWSFAPHDISAILFLLGESPTRISTHGGNYLNHNVDTTLTTCEFPSGVKAHIFVSWLHPFKEQKLAIVGGRKMAVFDDVEPDRKLLLYSHRIDWVNRVPVALKDSGQVVPLPKSEPLRLECEHFLQCIRTRQQPRTSGESAVRVLQVLEGCERSLKVNGQPVNIGLAKPEYFAHATAVLDEGCEIGKGTHIWHFSHIMSGSKIGAHCNFGQNVVISPEVVIGANVKIQNNVTIYTGVELEDDVFCGPSMVFTNVINPRSHVPRKNEYRRTLVKQGASMGANSTVVCGVTLGRYCFIGAGAVVTKDVPDYALMVGVPAERIGWMCYCGIRLPDEEAQITCAACGRRYRFEHETCKEIEVTDDENATVIAAWSTSASVTKDVSRHSDAEMLEQLFSSDLAIDGGQPVRTRKFAPWPSLSEDEVEAATAVLRSGKLNYWTGEQGRRFETEFAAVAGCQHAVAVANGTVALELALYALGIGACDEVIVPSRTFVASASCVVSRGARPVFADVDPISQTLTADSIRAVLSANTKAIIAVHLAGWPCDMDPINELARERGLKVIEDCAQAHGATYKGRPVGCLGDAAAFSFCQDKIISTGGEGGMLTTNDGELWKRAWSFKDHGKAHDAANMEPGSSGFRWLHDSFGTNWRLTEMQAAIGRSLLAKLPSQVESRRRNANILNQRLAAIPSLRVTIPPPEIGHAYYKYYVFLRPEWLRDGWNREQLIRAIVAEGVPCFSGSCSEVYLEKAFPENMRPARRLQIARQLGDTSLMFLVHPTLAGQDILDTARAVEKLLKVATVQLSEAIAS
jgi:UDP-2-acetamido-3-amino-2,3-dideoxy-glucuronate N-acetyltransferase